MSEWVPFDDRRGSGQLLPPTYKPVLIYVPEGATLGRAASIAVGYLKFAAGDPYSPYFVSPGVGHTPIAWCDVGLTQDVAAVWSAAKAATENRLRRGDTR